MKTKTLRIMVILLPALLAGGGAAAQQRLAHKGKAASGGAAGVGFTAFAVDPASGAVTLAFPEGAALTEDEERAVGRAPAWLQPDLRDALSRLAAGDRAAIAALILAVDEPRIMDEVAFTFAHLAPEDVDLSRRHLDVAIENARWLYEVDPDLPYVELVDVGDPLDGGDYYTTARYVAREGEAETTTTIPRDIYYWYVVHPIMDCQESMTRIVPATGYASTTGGSWWRAFSYGDNEAQDGQRPALLRRPNDITDAWLAAADFGAEAAAAGVLTGPQRSWSAVIREASTRAPVFLSWAHGDGRCCDASWPNPDGQVFVTTVPVEAAAAEGDDELLENMLVQGQGNRELRPNVLVGPNLGDTSTRKVLILRDRLPFDGVVDPNETILARRSIEYDVRPSSELAGLPIAATESPFVPLAYVKIVVPSDQPRALYETLAANKAKIETFVDYGGVFELHGATRAADDWTDLEMPFGIDAEGLDGSPAVGALEVAGFPLLKEVIEGTPYLWDRQKAVLPGERAYDPDEGAIAKIGWWTANNLPWRVVEMMTWRRDPAIQRAIYPVRILYNHYGNCGEIQDIYGAAMRALLIPCQLTESLADDHVWNEFYEDGMWHALQVDWSGSVTQIDNWSVAYDADVGGNKTVSGMTATRPDCRNENLLGRYTPVVNGDGIITADDYSFHVTLRATVTDRDGAPVDGARILIATPSLYNPMQLAIATWASTGPDGVAEITVGENNTYYYRVESPLGTLPDPGHVSLWVTQDETAEPGAVLEKTFAYLGDDPEGVPFAPVPAWQVAQTAWEPPPAGEPARTLAVTIEAGRELAYGASAVGDKGWMEPAGEGLLDLYLVDEANYRLLAAGGSEVTAQAIRAREGVAADTFQVDLPLGGGTWYLVVAGPGRLVNAVEFTALLETTERPLPADEEEDAGEEEADAATDAQEGGDTQDEEGAPDVEGGGCACALS